MRILLKNGRLYDSRTQVNEVKNLLIEAGKIVKISEDIDIADEIIDCEGKWIAPSVCDLHVHCFERMTDLGLDADQIGFQQNVGTLIDAGSCGCANVDQFYQQCQTKQTAIYSFINYAACGLTVKDGELSKKSYIDEARLSAVIHQYPQFIKGIKLRASATVVKDRGIKPIIDGQRFAKVHHLPIMVHIGNQPPQLEQVLELLEKGDIITHIFHGKAGGIFDEQGNLKELVKRKYAQGVWFDVGHGAASFSFEVAEKAIQNHLIPQCISSDLHVRNFKTKIHSLEEIVTKLYGLGMSETEIIEAICIRPALLLQLHNEICVGTTADLSVISFNQCQPYPATDAYGNQRMFDKKVKFEVLIKGRRNGNGNNDYPN